MTIRKNIVILFITLGFSHSAQAVDGNAILKKVDRNLQPESYEMYRKLINIEPDGSRKEFVLYTVKQGTDKMLVLFLSPASEKGRSSLRLDENMWLYIPDVGKPIRITSLQSVVGGVFNNSDILRLDYSVEYDVEKSEEHDKTYTLHLKAKNKAVSYDRLKMWVDKKALVPLTIEAYAASGMLIKTLTYDKVTDFKNRIIRPARLVTTSPLYKDYKSVMLFSNIKKRSFPAEVFTLNYLPRAENLR